MELRSTLLDEHYLRGLMVQYAGRHEAIQKVELYGDYVKGAVNNKSRVVLVVTLDTDVEADYLQQFYNEVKAGDFMKDKIDVHPIHEIEGQMHLLYPVYSKFEAHEEPTGSKLTRPLYIRK